MKIELKKLFLLVVLTGTIGVLSAQAQTVSGTVTDAEDGSSIPGVNVLVKGTSSGTVTGLDGGYTINASSDDVLVFSFVGYTSEEVQVGNQSTINVGLTPDVQSLQEIVVVGYGTQTKREITGSISKVDGAKLQQVAVPSFEAALQGQAAGVQVIQGSGIAGAGSVIRIRGIASVSANGDPLYVVDGIPITADNFLAEANWQNGAFNNNPLASINPNDIESIEILKDAAAAGIYGSRGSNGVILITTKRGKLGGKPTFNFSANVGTSQPVAKPNLLNSQEWLQLRQEAWELDGNTGAVWLPGYSSATASPEERLAAFNEASQHNTDWWDLLTQTGIRQQYDLSSRFSLGKMAAYIGGSYANNESYLKDNSFRRMSLRANIDYELTNNLDVSLSSSISQGLNRRVRVSYTGGLGDAMSTALPIYPVFNEEGEYFRGNVGTIANPLFTNNNFSGYTVDNRTINTLALKYNPIKDLNFTLTGGYDYLEQHNDQWESGLLRNQFSDLDNDGTDETPQNRAERDSRFVKNFNMSALAEYDWNLNDQNRFKFMVGSEYQQSVTSGRNNIVYLGTNINGTQFKEGTNFISDSVNTENLDILSNEKWSFLSFFTRINYTLKDRYIFQATARADGSSRFGSENRFGFFPVLSGAWMISEEDFMKNAGFIDFLKLKAAYGITGNSNFPANEWIGTYSVPDDRTIYNNLPIRFQNKVPNPDLQWETTRNIDLGFELGILDQRVDLEMSYYDRNTTNVLMSLILPNYNGFGNFWENIGEINNRGIEGTLKTINVQTPNFTWSSNFNIAYNTNQVLSIGGYSEDAVSGGTNDTRIVEGYPVGTNFLIPYAGVDPDNGRPMYLDINGNLTYEYNEERDRQPVGDVLPDAIGSLANTFTYKNFDLNFMFVYTIGGNIYDSSSKRQLTFLTDWNVREDVGNRWRQPGDEAKYPKVTLSPAEHGNDKEWFNTDLYLHDATFVRLRNLSLGYTLPPDLLSNVGISNARIVLSGTNLLTFTKFPGLDPEIARDFDSVTDRNLSPNITYLTPPQERSYNLTLNVSF